MIILDTPQGTTDWIVQRLWRLTASEMKTNITSTGKLSKSEAAIKHIDKLIAGMELANVMLKPENRAKIDKMDEWELKRFMSHYTGEKFGGNLHTERGHECEPDAIAALSERVGSQIADVGMCVMGNDINGVVSCSPDGHEYSGGTLVAGAEVKSPCLCNYYRHACDGVLPGEYKLQVHASMAICEVEVWHFGSYFKGKPLFYHKVTRENFTDAVAASLEDFKSLYQERFELVKANMQRLEEAGKEAA